MEIYFTRHANQRLKLYRIDKSDINLLVNGIEPSALPLNQRMEFVSDDFVLKYGFPIKYVIVNEGHRIVVITVFRYDKDTKYENILR